MTVTAGRLDPGAERRGLGLEAGGAVLRLTVGGVWTIADGLADAGPVATALAAGGVEAVEVVCQGLAHTDSALAVFLVAVHDLCRGHGVRLDLSRADPGLAALVGLARAVPEQSGTGRDGDGTATGLERVGNTTMAVLREVDCQFTFVGELCRSLARLVRGRARFRWRDVVDVLEDSGPRSLLIVTVICLLIGMILAFIGAVQLRRFGAGLYVADLVGLSITREMAAVMTAIVVAGKTGAAFAARIGAMQAQEEIDALTTLGLSPMDFLVLPRVVGLALMMPLLYLYGCGVGLAGGMLIGTTIFDLSLTQYWAQTQAALRPVQFVIGLSKSLVFGVLIAMAGCMRGIRCGRSAAAVGEATTSAVVTAILYIIVTDAVFAVVLQVLGL